MTTRITEVEVRDLLRIEYVKVIPDGSLTIVGGKNEQGKTSFLSGIACAIGGKKLCPEKPIREGKDYAEVSVRLTGDESLLLPPCVVTRKFWRRDDGSIKSEMEIKDDEGVLSPAPQDTLNRLISNLTFDPLAFTRMKPKEQMESLRSLVGIDFTELDKQYFKLFENRKLVNKEVKQLDARVASTPAHQDAPEELISVSSLTTELEQAQKKNRENLTAKQEVKLKSDSLRRDEQDILNQEERVKQLELQLQQEKEKLQQMTDSHKDKKEIVEGMEKHLETLLDVDTKPIQDAINQAEEKNEKFRANEKRLELIGQHQKKKKEADDLTKKLDNINRQKQELRESANWPIDGLGFDENGVTYKGLPFSQASSAEQIQVSVSMGMAMNPRLKLLLIENGSLLDVDHLKMVAKIAAENGGQVFMERVSEGSECQIIFQDGKEKVVEESSA